MHATLHWARAHRHLLALKAAVALAMVAAHHFPNSRELGLVVNLIWLALF
jgi:hypothetical protein